MQIENVTRIGFTSRRTTQQQGHLAIGNGLLGQIIINDQRVHAVIPEIFCHGATGKRRQILQRSRIGGGSGNNDGIFQRAVFLKGFHNLRNSGTLLANHNINAVEFLAFIIRGIDGLLIEDRVHRNGRLAGLAVANNQLALTASDRDKAVNGLEAGHHRLMHRFTRHDAGGLHVHTAGFGRFDRTFTINRVAKAINDTAQQALANACLDNRACPLDRITFTDITVGTKNHDTDVIGFKVEGQPFNAAREFDHFTGLNIVQTINAGNAVTDGKHLANL